MRVSRRRWTFGVAALASALGAGAFAGCSDDSSRGSVTGGADASTDGTTTNPNGDATTGGDGSIPPAPSGPIDPAAAARAALLIATCISDDGVNRTLQELYLERTSNPYRSRAVLECLATKTNGCAAVTDCLGLRYSGDGGCGDASCTDNVYSECSGADFRLTVDCTKTGRTCIAKPGAYCAANGEVECAEDTTAGLCDGTTPVACVDGLLVRGRDCAQYGATCEVLYTYQTGGSMTGCKGAAGACTGTSNDDALTARWEGVRCENGKLVGCLENGLATLDCAESALGFTCFDAPDGGSTSAAYCGTAAECSPKSPWAKVAATCEGTSVVMCNGGKIEKVDCTSLGFTGCAAGLCTPGFL
jgi:hypothetical protein